MYITHQRPWAHRRSPRGPALNTNPPSHSPTGSEQVTPSQHPLVGEARGVHPDVRAFTPPPHHPHLHTRARAQTIVDTRRQRRGKGTGIADGVLVVVVGEVDVVGAGAPRKLQDHHPGGADVLAELHDIRRYDAQVLCYDRHVSYGLSSPRRPPPSTSTALPPPVMGAVLPSFLQGGRFCWRILFVIRYRCRS